MGPTRTVMPSLRIVLVVAFLHLASPTPAQAIEVVYKVTGTLRSPGGSVYDPFSLDGATYTASCTADTDAEKLSWHGDGYVVVDFPCITDGYITISNRPHGEPDLIFTTPTFVSACNTFDMPYLDWFAVAFSPCSVFINDDVHEVDLAPGSVHFWDRNYFPLYEFPQPPVFTSADLASTEETVLTVDFWMRYSLTNPTVTAVPQSPEDLLEVLIDYVNHINLAHGLANSLDAKLQNALDALLAANAGDREDAINKLQAFINAVEAQAGKAISQEDAAVLIQMAQQIIALLQ